MTLGSPPSQPRMSDLRSNDVSQSTIADLALLGGLASVTGTPSEIYFKFLSRLRRVRSLRS